MERYPIGVMTWVLGDPYKAVRLALDVGIETMQLGCPPENFYKHEIIAEFKKFLNGTGINVTAVFCGYVGEDYSSMETIVKTVGLRGPELREERIMKTFQISDFAQEIGVDVIAAHIGFIPEDHEDPLYKGLIEAVRKIADYCEKKRQSFALETGQEPAKVLLDFIKDVGKDNIKVNFDPANMLFYGSGDPVKAVEILKDFIIGIHCKDFRIPKEGEKVTFENFVLFGEGDVGAEMFLKKLKEIGYYGPLTIEREIEDIEQQKKDMIRNKNILEELREKVLSPE
jgi:sugar phosphate isomerase/epimerase